MGRVLRFSRCQRPGVLAAALIIGAAVAGCDGGGPDPEQLAAARERVADGMEAVGAADGGRWTYAIVASENGTEISSSCFTMTQEPTSVAEDRAEIYFGTYLPDAAARGMCSPNDGFIADGSTVYVATDEQPEGRQWWIHDWAQVEPDVLAQVRDVEDDLDTDYTSLVDAASSVEENAMGDVVIGIGWDDLVEAGVLSADQTVDGASGTVTFSFADDGSFSEVHYVVEASGAEIEILQQFDDLGEEQEITVPEDPFLNPESEPITTVEDFQRFVGLG